MRFYPRLTFLFAAFSFFATTLPSVASASEAGITISRVFSGWRDAASFKRISEYFTGRENTGGVLILRTHPEQRSGFYFFIRANNPGSPVAVKVNVELITPTDSKSKIYSFSTELKSGQNIMDLGLTAADWSDATAHPVAWKIDFVNTEGHVLAVEKSYLWEKPVAP